MIAFTPLLGVCLGLLLLLFLEQGFKYGNPLPARIPLEDRLSPRARAWFSVLGSTAVLLGLIAVLAWDFNRWH
jgi:hypothetical protein